MVLRYDPLPWLTTQDDPRAARARLSLGLKRDGDLEWANVVASDLASEQLDDGSFDHSPLRTAGILNLLSDIRAKNSKGLMQRAAHYLFEVLESQPGYERAGKVKPGSLSSACDLCGFFGPYEDKNLPEAMVRGAREMNFYREYEPLLGPKSPVRDTPRSSFDRPGPGSCYAWGLVPLSYIIEGLCRAGHGRDAGIKPALNALLGVQRASGGWCRNLRGHPSCSLHALRALGAHPRLKKSDHAERALAFLQGQRQGGNRFAMIHAVSAFNSPTARSLLAEMLQDVAGRQRKNGTFGTPCRIERVAAVLAASRVVDEAPPPPAAD